MVAANKYIKMMTFKVCLNTIYLLKIEIFLLKTL